jgi:hypothetical protein
VPKQDQDVTVGGTSLATILEELRRQGAPAAAIAETERHWRTQVEARQHTTVTPEMIEAGASVLSKMEGSNEVLAEAVFRAMMAIAPLRQ